MDDVPIYRYKRKELRLFWRDRRRSSPIAVGLKTGAGQSNGYLAAAAAKGMEGETIAPGTGNLESVRTVVEELYGLIGPQVQPAFGSISERALEQTRTANAEASFRRLAWRAEKSVRDGLSHTAEWYREQLRRGNL